MTVIRRAIASALSLAGLAALVAFAPVHPVGEAMAQSATAALVAKPVSLPDMALGPTKAPVTITEYASMSCPHCAAFEENVFPMLRINCKTIHLERQDEPQVASAGPTSRRCLHQSTRQGSQ